MISKMHNRRLMRWMRGIRGGEANRQNRNRELFEACPSWGATTQEAQARGDEANICSDIEIETDMLASTDQEPVNVWGAGRDGHARQAIEMDMMALSVAVICCCGKRWAGERRNEDWDGKSAERVVDDTYRRCQPSCKSRGRKGRRGEGS